MGCTITSHNSHRGCLEEGSPQVQLKGHRGKVEVLYHATSREVAAHLVFSGGRLLEMEGRKILFTDSEKRAKTLQEGAEAIVKAYVRVGLSLVIPADTDVNSLKALTKAYPCNSLLLAREEGARDYLIDSWTRACIVLVKVQDASYYEVDEEPKQVTECGNSQCLFTGKSHLGHCRSLCDNPNCLYYDKYHLGECNLPCTNRKCSQYGRCHVGACEKQVGTDALVGANIVSVLAAGWPAGRPGGQGNLINSLFNFY